jgi:hypothetical protein
VLGRWPARGRPSQSCARLRLARRSPFGSISSRGGISGRPAYWGGMDSWSNWARETFGCAELGDARRTKRLMQIAAQAGRRPSGRISAVFESDAERQDVPYDSTRPASHERDDAPNVKLDAPVFPHVEAALAGSQRARCEPPSAARVDTCVISRSSIAAKPSGSSLAAKAASAALTPPVSHRRHREAARCNCSETTTLVNESSRRHS